MAGYLPLPLPRLQLTSANAKAQALVFDCHVVGQEKSWKKSDPISLEISQTQDLSSSSMTSITSTRCSDVTDDIISNPIYSWSTVVGKTP